MSQLTLSFDAPTGVQLRNVGMQRAANNANDVVPNWTVLALEFVAKFNRNEFMTEEVREFAYENGLPRPPHERAWGSVMTVSKGRGLIEFARYAAVSNPKAHATPATVWRKCK